MDDGCGGGGSIVGGGEGANPGITAVVGTVNERVAGIRVGLPGIALQGVLNS